MPIESVDGLEIRKTQWHNPTTYKQKVRICMGGHWRNVVWAPGETIELDSSCDRAIQVVICQADECNGRGPAVTEEGVTRINCQPCTRGHAGQIMAGQAPLLVRVGMGDTPNPTLDPEETLRRQRAEEARRIVENQKAITEAFRQAQLTPIEPTADHKPSKKPQNQPSA